MRDRKGEVSAAGLVVLGVSFDTPEENKAFREKFDFPFRLLCDTERQLGLAYGAAKTPKDGYAARISYVIDEEGQIAFVYPKVNPAAHLDEVLKDVVGG